MSKKMMLLVAAVVPTGMVMGCAGTFHQAFIHISELTQLVGALNQLGVV